MQGLNESELHKYIVGETRVDGWKSQWRRDLEAYRAAPKVEVRVMLTVRPEARVRKLPGLFNNCAYAHKRRAERKAQGICVDCGNAPAIAGKLNCEPCQLKRNERGLKRYYARKAAV